MAERLHKWLAGLGLGSRREIEGWIKAGRVSVDGVTAELGRSVTGAERIVVDGKPVRAPRYEQRLRVLMYHKPPGEICARKDPEGRRTVFESLPRLAGGRWITIGRLDYQTSGLLLFTTDGALAHRLMHPSGNWLREYSVRVLGQPSEQQLSALLTGVELEDGPAKFESLTVTDERGANKTYRVTVSEGRNRIVRRLFEAAGCRVNRLMRVRFGPIELPRALRPGSYRDLTPEELAALGAEPDTAKQAY